MFSFYSYRDPNPLKSLETFRSSFDWFSKSNGVDIKDQDLLEAKLGIFKNLDAPLDLDAEGLEAFYSGCTKEMLEKRRRSYLEVSLNDLKELVWKYFSPNGIEASNISFASAIIGGNEAIELELAKSNWNIIKNI